MDEAPEAAASQDPCEPAVADPFYQRPVWRALLIFGAVLGMCALFAVLFPETYWRF